MALHCPIPGAGQLWTVLEFRRVEENYRASILRRQLYLLPVELIRTREEEESWSDHQEQDDIDSAGEVEY